MSKIIKISRRQDESVPAEAPAWPVPTLPSLLTYMMLAVLLIVMIGCGSGAGEQVDSLPASTAGGIITVEPHKPAPAPAQTQTQAQTDSREGAAERLLAAFDAGREFGIVSTLAGDEYQGRKTGSAGATAAAAYISAKFEALGLQPWTAAGLTSYYHPFSASGYLSDNVIGILPGSAPGGRYIILAAHYDHLGLDSSGQPFNGADDNAAGVAAVLEIANIFRQTGVAPSASIVFCAFSGEEEDQLGSAALGRQLVSAGLEDRVEMINIDGIGATGGDYFGVWDEGFAAAAPLVQALKQAGLQLGTPVKEEGTDIGSDAQSFDWSYEIPAVTVDWSWGSDPDAWHPYYHTIDDDADRIDGQVMAQATRVVILGLWGRAA